MSAVDVSLEDLWDRVPGQGEAVAVLRSSVGSPTHAYLITGPEGSGKSELATAFAASLLARDTTADEADRIASRVAAGSHGGFIVVEREGQFLTADEARSVVERSVRSPKEGPLQVIVITDFHMVRDAGPMLLKSIEEPPPSTIFVLLAEDLPRELDTIASRCVSIVLHPLPLEVLVDRLASEGSDPDRARVAAHAAGGNLRRARLLVRDAGVVDRRELWYRAPERVDGRGSTACSITDDLLGSIASLEEPLAEMEAEEIEALQQRHEEIGTTVRKGDLNRIQDRYKRAARRIRTDEIRNGLGVLVSRYRDEMSTGGDPAIFTSVAEAVQRVGENLVFNASEELALQSLFMSIPPLDGRSRD